MFLIPFLRSLLCLEAMAWCIYPLSNHAYYGQPHFFFSFGILGDFSYVLRGQQRNKHYILCWVNLLCCNRRIFCLAYQRIEWRSPDYFISMFVINFVDFPVSFSLVEREISFSISCKNLGFVVLQLLVVSVSFCKLSEFILL